MIFLLFNNRKEINELYFHQYSKISSFLKNVNSLSGNHGKLSELTATSISRVQCELPVYPFSSFSE